MTKQYKILMVAGVDVSKIDGPVGHFLSLAEAFIKKGHMVYAFASAKESHPEINFLKSIKIPKLPLISAVVYQIKLFYMLLGFLKKNKTDFMYVRSHYFMFSPILISKIFHIPIISENNGLLVDIEGKRPKIILKIGEIIERKLISESRVVIVVTSFMKQWITDIYGIDSKKIFVINNAANPEKFAIHKRNEFRREFNFINNEKIILYAGTLIWWQGVEFLIKAVSKLKEKNKSFKLIIVGEGPERYKLEELVKIYSLNEIVSFKGYIKNDIAIKYMCASDICVTPKVPISSGYSPIKLYEYMAAARPVIASDLPGFEIIKDFDCGRLFKSLDENALAGEIEYLLNKSDVVLDEMGLRGRKMVEKEYNWNRVAEKTIEIVSSAGI